MGFDNGCILNIQKLAREYFCPVYHTLVYPNEALQSQCTHLYCKPCLAYVVNTTRACPYHGYLCTEADSLLSFDRAPHGFSSEARGNLDVSASSAALTLLSQYHGGGFLRDDNAGRKIDHGGVHPDFHLHTSEISKFHTDALPRQRSPVREYSDTPLKRFRSIEDCGGHAFGEPSKPFCVDPDSNPYFEGRLPLLPSHLCRGEFDAPGNSRIMQSSGPLGRRNLHMGEPGGYGTFLKPSRLGDLPLNSRTWFNASIPGRGSSDGRFFNASLDHSRKGKHGSITLCWICKVECETVEGHLEMHSQSREHQKIAMEMVINIKKDNAKKQKVSYDEHISHEGDANKSRKASVNNQGE